MAFEFISNLCESKLFPTRQEMKRYSLKDAADLAFLYLCTLIILNSEYAYAPSSVEYARKTKQFGHYKMYRQAATDLYVLLNMVMGDSAEAGDPAANLFSKRLNVKESDIKILMNALVANKSDSAFFNQIMMRIEKQLGISNVQYKAVRRLAVDWNNLDHGQKKLATTRLLQAFRMRARRSELLPVLNALAKDKNLEIKGAVDQEQQEPESDKFSAKRALGALAAGGAIGWALGKRLA